MVSIIVLFVPQPNGNQETVCARRRVVAGTADQSARHRRRVRQTKGCAVAAQPSGKTAPDYPSYLRTAEVADLLSVSPKTVSRWAKEGKLPFLKTLGGHRRYPEAEIPELAEELREDAMT